MEAPSRLETEQELINLAKKDPRHFKSLYDGHFPKIFHFILKRVGEKEIASDITQQVFFNALTSLKRYRYKGASFSAFLFRIAINECNQFFRDQKRVRYVSIESQSLAHVKEEFDWKMEEEQDEMEVLEKVLQKLNHDQLTLVELRFFEKRSFKEVADILSITENLAKVRTYRLLDKMKKMIQDEK